MRDATAKHLSTLHTLVYRATGGRLGTRLVDNDMLLLTTRGRLSGKPHTVPLLYLREGDRFVVFASWGGRDYPPHWYLNLRADPNVKVQVAGRRLDCTARDAGPTERDHWWAKATEAYDGYAVYQSRTDREIPVVMLTPA